MKNPDCDERWERTEEREWGRKDASEEKSASPTHFAL
jgi:hypothetical protein